MNNTPALNPTEYDTVERFGIHADDIIDKVNARLNSHTTTTPPALAEAPQPAPVLACHLDCARTAILAGCLPTSTLTDYRVFSTAGSVRGAVFAVEPLQVIARAHHLDEALLADAAAARVPF